MGQALGDFVSDNEILTLNVAGSRASKETWCAEFVREVLGNALSRQESMGGQG
jgi:hypothetical protein